MTQLILILGALLATAAGADAGDPVKVFGRLKDAREKTILLELGMEIGERGFRVYKESVKVRFPGHVPVVNLLPPGEKRPDPLSHGVKEVYAERVSWPVELERNSRARDEVVEVRITYRACNDITCHFPRTKVLRLSPGHPVMRAEGKEGATRADET